MNESTCKGCGAPIVWAKSVQSTHMIPLDRRPTFYGVYEEHGETLCVPISDKNVMISHFATCPKANQFSRKNAKVKA